LLQRSTKAGIVITALAWWVTYVPGQTGSELNFSSDALRLPFAVEDSESYCNLGVNNLGNSRADVKIFLVSSQGGLLGSTELTIPSQGLVQINHIVPHLQETSANPSPEGCLVIESHQDIRAWVSMIDKQSLDPSLMLASAETSSRILIPSSVSSHWYSSRLIVVNASPENGALNIAVRDPTGVIQASRANLPIAGNGYLHFRDIYEAMGLTGAERFGPIELEADGEIQLQALLHIRSSERTGGFFSGVNPSRAGRNLVLPYLQESSDFRTNLGLNNPGPVSANVTLSFVDDAGVIEGTLHTILPPHTLTQLNRILRLLSGSEGISKLEGGLLITADQDLFAWTSLIDNLSQDPALAVAQSRGAARWLIPSTTSLGNFRSSLALRNLDNGTAQVELKARAPNGDLQSTFTTPIAGQGMLVSKDIRAELGLAGSFGPLEITSLEGNPLLAVSQVSSAQRTGGSFSGIPLEQQRRVLYLTQSAGFEHGVLPLSEDVLKELGEQSGAFQTTVSRDSSVINRENLKGYDALVFYTTGELPFSSEQKQAFLDFVLSGKAFVGIHSATDTFYTWLEYGELIGAYFDGHPWHQEVTIQTEDPLHPATRHLAPSFRITDEIYQFRSFSREKVHVLLRLDNSSVDLNAPGVNRADRYFANAWTRQYGSGRVFYTALGHRDEVWRDPRFQQHLLNGIRWAMGDVR
jgi:uncharacterized protein